MVFTADDDEMAQTAPARGRRPPSGRSATGDEARPSLERHTAGSAASIDMAEAAEEGDEILRRHRLQAPSNATLLGRTLVQLQGLLVQTGVDVQLWELLEPYAARIAARRYDPRRVLRKAARTTKDWERLIESLPRDITQTLDGIRSGELQVPLRLERLDRYVNRLVYAFLASSLFLGSSRLWANGVPPTARGISVPGSARDHRLRDRRRAAAAGRTSGRWHRLTGPRRSA